MKLSVFRPLFRYSVSKKCHFRFLPLLVLVLCYIQVTTATESLEIKDDLKPWTDIPGPSSLPIIGPLRHFLPGGEFYNVTGLDLTENFYKKYGKIMKIDPAVGQRHTLIMLFDAEASEKVLRSENTRLPIRPGFESLEYYRKIHKKGIKPDQTTGLITDHNERWREFRSVVGPVLLQPRIIKLYQTALDEVALEMIKRMKSLRDEKNMLTTEIDREMNLWSLESISVVALGCRLGCLDPNLPKDSPAHDLISCVHDLFKVANQLDFELSFWRWFSTPLFKKAMELYEKQEQLSKHFIDQAMREMKTKSKSEEEKGILEKVLEINEEYAYIMAGDMLFAGVDTAANTVIATLYLLATNKDKQTKLRKELATDQKQSYLKACIKEGMRVMPIVSGNIRKTTKEYDILGYKIPKDMLVVFNHHYMSLLEENFPSPREYIPERWLVNKDDPLSHRQASPLAYSPFGFGVRMCAGRRIAELEMETFMARLIENFEVDWFGPPPKIEQQSLNYIKGPFNFAFKDAK